MLSVDKATPEDLERILRIYDRARAYMIAAGNPDQWGRTRPAPERIREDIRQGVCRLVRDGEGIHGVFALLPGAEPTYAHIEGGAWPNQEPYLTLHRLAGDGQVHGIFACVADYCKARSPQLRIDTHEKNRVMRHLIEQQGFRFCGVIRVEDGSPRLAYQWSRPDPFGEPA